MIKRFTPNSIVMRQLRIGLLSAYLDGFAKLLVQQGYSSQAGWKKIRLIADLSRWLVRQRLQITQLDEQQAAAFLDARWKRHPRQSGDQSTLTLLLRHLRQLEAIPNPTASCGAIDFIQRDYGHFMIHERGFVPESAAQYVHVMGRFLSNRFPDGQIKLPKLCEKDVTDFVMYETLQLEIITVIESLNQLRESPEYELCQISEQKSGVLDELAAERTKLLETESSELEKQADRLAKEIKELSGQSADRIV